MFRALSSYAASKLTATASTAITCIIPPHRRGRTRLTRILYRCGSTAHTITVMKALGSTTLTAAVAASGTSITLAADPGTTTAAGAIANSDWIAIRLDDGSVFLTTISSLSTLTMTVNALPSAAAAGSKVWFFGVPGDHASSQTQSTVATISPATILKGKLFLATVSVMNDWGDAGASIEQTLNIDEPLVVHSDNATAAGTFELVSGVHTTN